MPYAEPVKTYDRSQGRAAGVAAVSVFAAFALAGCSLLLPADQPTRDDESGEVVEGGQESAFNMQVGDCWNDVTTDEVSDVPMVPCAEEHDNEVYAEFDLPDGAFPGDDAVEEAAFDGCYERFADYIGISYEESVLEIYPMWPTEAGWDELNDRQIVCSVWDVEGALTGSVKGAAR